MGWNGANTYGVRVDSARVADTTPWTGITGKPTTVAGYGITDIPKWYDGWVANPGYDANTIGPSKSGFSYSNNAAHTGPLVYFDAGGYGLQLSADYSGGGEGMSFRTRNGDTATWNGWNRFITTDNFINYGVDLTSGQFITGIKYFLSNK